MNGEIAQSVTLVCQGNAFLAGHGIPDLLATNSSFKFCANVTFDGPYGTTPATPNLWLQSLRDEDVYGLRLSCTARNDPRFSDRMTAGLTGAGSFWAIEALKRNGISNFYTPRWAVGDQSAPDNRIWLVKYPKIATQKTTASTARPVATMTVVLTGALNQIHAFAQSHPYCEPFANAFARALDLLHGKMADPVYHLDLFPADQLSAEAANLLNACEAAWVFGAMGSWNDMSFDNETDQATYDAVSNYLYASLTEAIPVAANNSFRPL